MKIKRNEPPASVVLHSIAIGGCFSIESTLYMVVNVSSGTFLHDIRSELASSPAHLVFGVCIRTGNVIGFGKGLMVRPAEVEAVEK